MSYQTQSPLHITVLKGGVSSERDISLQSGAAIAQALRNAGHTVSEVVVTERKLPLIPVNTQVVFPALHGEFGEDGKIQTLLEDEDYSFVGCDSRTSALIMSKSESKKCVSGAAIPVARDLITSDPHLPFPTDFKLPFIVKPDAEGSTIGLTLVKSEADWKFALLNALQHGGRAMIEEFLVGTEITVGVLDGQALPVVEIIPPGELFDFDAKYAHSLGETQYNCPPTRVDACNQAEAQELAEICYTAMNCRHMVRVDFIVTDRGPYFLEANSLPGFTASSLLPKSAARAGLCFEALCDQLVQAAHCGAPIEI